MGVQYSFITVPAPDLVVSATYTTPLYVGSSLTLTCTVTLDPNVDNSENVTASWSGPSDITGERFLVTAASGSFSTYTSTSNLTIIALAEQDDGTYTCTVLVTGENEQHASTSDSHTIPTICKPTLFKLYNI